MKIAILSALQVELDGVLEGLEELTSSELAGWSVWRGHRAGHDVVVARAGLGKVNTAALTALLWGQIRPSLFVFTGVAGGLDPARAVGDVVIARSTIQHDAGVITAEGLERYQAGHIPFFNPTDEFGYRPSQRVLSVAMGAAERITPRRVLGIEPTIVFGTILTGDQFLQDAGTRDRIFAETGAIAIEMEGAAMAQVATRVGSDHLVIRSLSDLAGDESVEDFGRFLPQVAANSSQLVLALLERLQEDHRDLPIGP